MIAILYICTGNYQMFWKGFYLSTEKYFIPEVNKVYFVFTDAEEIFNEKNSNINKIFQKKLGWPLDTLMRFEMFSTIKNQLKEFDYIFFLNANMRCQTLVSNDILPLKEDFLAVKHPGFYNKQEKDFTYERNPKSMAYIEQGKYYFMGGFNGGKANEFLSLIDECKKNIHIDLSNGIVAVWHDESHLNHYLLNKNVKILSPSYGYPENWSLPFEKKIIILDKQKHGGHEALRGTKRLNPIIKLKDNIFNFIKGGNS